MLNVEFTGETALDVVDPQGGGRGERSGEMDGEGLVAQGGDGEGGGENAVEVVDAKVAAADIVGDAVAGRPLVGTERKRNSSLV